MNQLRVGAVLLVVALIGLILVPGHARAGASPAQRSTPLPEMEGVQGVAVDASNAYVVWADSPAGHSAAVSDATGEVVWHATTARSASLVAAGNGVVWTTQNTGSSLVEQQGITGRTLAQHTAPAETDWRSIAATGPYIYGLSDGAQDRSSPSMTGLGCFDRSRPA